MTKNVVTRKKRHCNHCNALVDTVIEVLSKGTHYGKENCAVCGNYVAFAKKPKNEGKRGSSRHSPDSLNITICQMCQRPANRLGSRGVLSVHHVEEIQHGGTDDPDNIWILCTSCHRLVHHQRTYLNVHLEGAYTFADLQEDMDKDGVPPDVQNQLKRIFLSQEGGVNA